MIQRTKSALRAIPPKNAVARDVSVVVGGTAGAQAVPAAVKTVYQIRNAAPQGLQGDDHPFFKQAS